MFPPFIKNKFDLQLIVNTVLIKPAYMLFLCNHEEKPPHLLASTKTCPNTRLFFGELQFSLDSVKLKKQTQIWLHRVNNKLSQA